ncbi:MAG TPA: transporter, partial [Burkholderiaceae bacterium]|nr:transporter [Burkholderiaceae bacterium]
MRCLRVVVAPLTAWALAAATPVVRAQSIEPRAYSNAPVDMNFLIGGLALTRGALAFDTLPITDPRLKTTSAVLGYARVLDLWGRSGKFDVVVPYTSLSGTATFQGGPIERKVDGPGDPLLRLSINLLGAPAMRLPEFRSYQQDLIVGASLQVSVPAGQYDATRLVNIGTHRWFFKPEIGASQALGPWTLEG